VVTRMLMHRVCMPRVPTVDARMVMQSA